LVSPAAQLGYRKRLRLFFEDIRVEVSIMAIVIVYALFIFADLIMPRELVRRGSRDRDGVVERGANAERKA